MGRFEQLRVGLRRAYAASRGPFPGPTDRHRGGRGNAADRHPGGDGRWPDETDPVSPAPVAGTAYPAVGRDDVDVPRGLRIAAAYSWRVLVVAAAVAITLWVIGRLASVLIPLTIALLLSALLSPAVGWLTRRVRLPSSLAVAVVLVGGLAAVIGVLTLVVTQFVNGLPKLTRNAADGIRQIQDWLRSGPLHLSNDQLTGAADAAQRWIDTHREALTSGALSTATTVVEVLASALLVLFSTFFFLRDGARIWHFVLRILPASARVPVGRAGEDSWQTLVSYVRATILVAFIDAVGIGLVLVSLRVQFAFSLAALVFLAAFVPIVGATVSGAVAVLVALVTRGPLIALAVLLAVIAIQQLEGHVLQPVIMGRAVALHPLAVIVAIATGLILAGIIGALVAVPLLAVLNTGIRRLIEHRYDPPPDAVVVSADPTP